MDEHGYGRFVDLVYEAAVEPDLWPRALEQLFDLVGGTCGALTWQNQATGGDGGAIEARLDPSVTEHYFYFADRNPLLRVERPREFMRSWVPRILTDEDWMAKEDLVRTEYYSDFMRPLDIHSSMTVRLAARGLDATFINIGRPARRGQFTPQDLEVARRLHPHLIHAFALGEKFAQTRRMELALADTLDRLPYGLFLVDGEARVRHANSPGEAMTRARGGLGVLSGRLCAPSPADTRRLQSLIAGASAISDLRTGGSMSLQRAEGRAPLSVLVAPVRPERVSMFDAGPTVVVCVTDPEARVGASELMLRDLFGLTLAEGQVAVALLEGRTPRETAEALGLSYFTVRGHLAHIFDKTGVKRQAELMSLLLRASGFATH